MAPLAGPFTLSCSGEPDSCFEFFAYPNVNSLRWLLPAQAGLTRIVPHFYFARGFGARVKKLLMQSGMAPRERVWIPKQEFEPLKTRLSDILGDTRISLAFYNGLPGANQKLTAQVLNSEGKVLAYAKLASKPLAIKALEREESNLLRLATLKAFGGITPRVLGSTTFLGSRVLVSSASPSLATSANWYPAHTEFLTLLHRSCLEHKNFSNSAVWQRTLEQFEDVAPFLEPVWLERFKQGLNLLDKELGHRTVPLGYAHGDFAPWNIRLGRTIFVFDWELGSSGVTPLYDAFHFKAIQSAAYGKGFFLNTRIFHELLSRVWPGGNGYLPWLYLVYLTDKSLFYMKSAVESGEGPKDQILGWFGKQMDLFR